MQNNPIRYSDPTGHQACAFCDGGGSSNPPLPPVGQGDYCETHPGACGGSPSGENSGGVNPGGGNGNGECNGLECEFEDPTPGDYLGGYNGPGGGLQSYSINWFNGSGGASVSVNYSAWYDVLLYENGMIIILHEGYWIPPATLPHLDDVAGGGSVLHVQVGSGEEFVTDLGAFSPGNIAKPRDLTIRDTYISFIGKNNFPTNLVIEIQFGASYTHARTAYYPLQSP